jgi:hypothetical protein
VGGVSYPALPSLYFYAVLEAALTDVPEPLTVQTINYDPKSPPSAEFPFRLTSSEAAALAEARAMARREYAVEVPGRFLGDLANALERAVRTLAAPQLEALSEEEERALSRIESAIERRGDVGVPVMQRGNTEVLASILRKRFPKPAAKTLGQIAWEARNADSWETASPGMMEAYEKMGAAVQAELVRRAEGK